MNNNNLPPLYGLVLSGGKSTRMGSDKGMLNYHGIPQRAYLFELLQHFCDQVYLSVRQEQAAEIGTQFPVVIDQDYYGGPFNGILSAHYAYPEVAWLILACDLPLMDRDTLAELVDQRKPQYNATAYATHQSKLPEPLICIWEPQLLKAAAPYLDNGGKACPRAYLLQSEVALVHPKRDELLFNANSLEDFQFAKSKLG
ncbi:MAG: NTP transferase domain-containing protein [Bacteroidota bacterium]